MKNQSVTNAQEEEKDQNHVSDSVSLSWSQVVGGGIPNQNHQEEVSYPENCVCHDLFNFVEKSQRRSDPANVDEEKSKVDDRDNALSLSWSERSHQEERKHPIEEVLIRLEEAGAFALDVESSPNPTESGIVIVIQFPIDARQSPEESGDNNQSTHNKPKERPHKRKRKETSGERWLDDVVEREGDWEWLNDVEVRSTSVAVYL